MCTFTVIKCNNWASGAILTQQQTDSQKATMHFSYQYIAFIRWRHKSDMNYERMCLTTYGLFSAMKRFIGNQSFFNACSSKSSWSAVNHDLLCRWYAGPCGIMLGVNFHSLKQTKNTGFWKTSVAWLPLGSWLGRTLHPSTALGENWRAPSWSSDRWPHPGTEGPRLGRLKE